VLFQRSDTLVGLSVPKILRVEKRIIMLVSYTLIIRERRGEGEYKERLGEVLAILVD